MPVKLLTSGGGGVNLVPSSSIASDQTMYLPTSGTSGGTVLCTDSSGNLGLGVTPSAWGSNRKILQLGGATYTYFAGTGIANIVSNNLYVDSAGTSRYLQSYAAGVYQQNGNGDHYWYTAPSGTAGNTISFTQAMTLDSSGNLTISGSTATKASGTTWANPSDQRLKDNIRDYEKGLVELMQVRVREWEYNGKGGTTEGLKGLGVVADEIEKILPNTVETYEAKLEETDEEVTTIKKFDATEITWLLVNAVKELTQRIEALEYTKQGE